MKEFFKDFKQDVMQDLGNEVREELGWPLIEFLRVG